MDIPIDGALMVYLPKLKDSMTLTVRQVLPGEIFQGKVGKKRVSRLMIDRKIPKRLRFRVPCVAIDGRLAWIWGLGKVWTSAGRSEHQTRLWVKPPKEFTLRGLT